MAARIAVQDGCLQAAAVSLCDQLHAIDSNPVIVGGCGAIAVNALLVPVS